MKQLTKDAEAEIIKTLVNKPFNLTMSKNHIAKLPQEFLQNKVAYKGLYTMLQIYPVYLRNIYKQNIGREDAVYDVKGMFRLIKDVFGDIE
mmetsp:Transcript_15366/g.13103  ORF Transcript_15366/g.13103 Transcript_15366/m.13103 type:complete len:91 (+) Transcript_15366:549-821(+)